MKFNSRIYVAGHLGLVGSAIIRALKQKGFNIEHQHNSPVPIAHLEDPDKTGPPQVKHNKCCTDSGTEEMMKKVKKIKNYKEMIEDMIMAAVNQGLQNAGKAAEEKMNSVTGGMMGKIKFPGM